MQRPTVRPFPGKLTVERQKTKTPEGHGRKQLWTREVLYAEGTELREPFLKMNLQAHGRVFPRLRVCLSQEAAGSRGKGLCIDPHGFLTCHRPYD